MVDHAWVAPVLVAIATFLIYAATLANDLTWQNFGGDGGELATASLTLGIPHPPGYPLYVAVGRLFALLPFGTIASRYSLFSAVAGSVAIALLIHSISIRNRGVATSVLPLLALGLALAMTPLFWSQAIIIEVYALFLALLAFFVWTIASDRRPWLIGLALGLSICGHLSALLLFPLALWSVGKADFGRFAGGALLGLVPFLLLPLLAGNASPVQWGNPGSLSGWWWLVSARLYQPNVLSLPMEQWPSRLLTWLNPFILVPFLVWLGLALRGVQRARRNHDSLPLAAMITAGLFSVYAFTYRTVDAAVLLLPAFVLLAWAASTWFIRITSIAIWFLPLLMLLFAHTSSITDQELNLRLAAAKGLNQVPEAAIVLTPGDPSIASLWYFNHVEGLRPDIILVDENMFQFDWYRDRLAREYPTLFVPHGDDLQAFAQDNAKYRAICRLTLSDVELTACATISPGAPLE